MHMSELVVAVWGTLYKDGIPLSKFTEAYEIADNIAHIAIVEATQELKEQLKEEIQVQSEDRQSEQSKKLFRGTKIQRVYDALLQGPKEVSELKKISGATPTTIYGYVKQLKAKRHRDAHGVITYSLQ